MDLPHPEQLWTTGSALAALDVKFGSDDPSLRSYAVGSEGGLDVLSYDNGGGDHVVVIRGTEGVLVKAFDHESALGRHARADLEPDPSLTLGLPGALVPWLDRVVRRCDGADRTFLAWWRDGAWISRGPDAFPVEQLFLDAEAAQAWIADNLGYVAESEPLAAYLSGALPLSDLALEPVAREAVEAVPGWRAGEAFTLVLRPAAPTRSVAVLKAVRAATGQPMGDVRSALAGAEVVFQASVGPFEFDRIRAASAIAAALDEDVGAAWFVEVAGALHAVSRPIVRSMLGAGAVFLN